MRRRGQQARRRFRRLGARLAFLALAIQAALPLLLALEIRAEAGTPAAFAEPLCLHDGGADRANHADRALAACPICIALAAAVAFTAPPGLALPAPPPAAAPRLFAAAPHSVTALSAAAYRSRAPPSFA